MRWLILMDGCEGWHGVTVINEMLITMTTCCRQAETGTGDTVTVGHWPSPYLTSCPGPALLRHPLPPALPISPVTWRYDKVDTILLYVYHFNSTHYLNHYTCRVKVSFFWKKKLIVGWFCVLWVGLCQDRKLLELLLSQRSRHLGEASSNEGRGEIIRKWGCA